MDRPDLPRASAFDAPAPARYPTERPVYPPAAGLPRGQAPEPIVRAHVTSYDDPDFLSAEIRRDVPLIVRIAFLGTAAIVAASVLGFVIHQIVSAF